MTTKKQTTKPRKVRDENEIALAARPFLPPALVGRRFIRDPKVTSNWLGAESFVVLGEFGPYTVPAYENASGMDYIQSASVGIVVDDARLFTVTRYEFLDLTRTAYLLDTLDGTLPPTDDGGAE